VSALSHHSENLKSPIVLVQVHTFLTISFASNIYLAKSSKVYMTNKFSSEKYLCIWNNGGERNQAKCKVRENTLT
jgi:hypothetical protein